jgi:hypothetical protein
MDQRVACADGVVADPDFRPARRPVIGPRSHLKNLFASRATESYIFFVGNLIYPLPFLAMPATPNRGRHFFFAKNLLSC